MCGTAIGGDQCWVCLARSDVVDEAFRVSAFVAGAGFLVDIMALGLYVPLGADQSTLPLLDYLPLICILGLMVLFLMLIGFPKLARSTASIRLMFAALVLPVLAIATLFILNGALDNYPPVATQAVVVQKKEGVCRSCRCIVLRLDFNQHQIQSCLTAEPQTYSTVEPGDSVTILVHPGRLAQPWFGGFYADQPHDLK